MVWSDTTSLNFGLLNIRSLKSKWFLIQDHKFTFSVWIKHGINRFLTTQWGYGPSVWILNFLLFHLSFLTLLALCRIPTLPLIQKDSWIQFVVLVSQPPTIQLMSLFLNIFSSNLTILWIFSSDLISINKTPRSVSFCNIKGINPNNFSYVINSIIHLENPSNPDDPISHYNNSLINILNAPSEN